MNIYRYAVFVTTLLMKTSITHSSTSTLARSAYVPAQCRPGGSATVPVTLATVQAELPVGPY